MITKADAESKTFAELVLWAVEALPASGTPYTDEETGQVLDPTELNEHGAIMRHLIDRHGQVKKAALVTELELFGLISSGGNGTPAAAAATVASPPDPVGSNGDATTAGTTTEHVEEETEEEEEEVEEEEAVAEDPEHTDDAKGRAIQALESYPFQVFVDGKHWPRTSSGQYVCPFCVSEGAEEPKVMDNTKGIGPHKKPAHGKDGSREIFDELVAEGYIHLFDEEAAATKVTQQDPAAASGTPDSTASTTTETVSTDPPGHRVLEETEQTAEPGQVQLPDNDFVVLAVQQGTESVLARMTRLETVVASLTTILLTLSDDELAALRTEFADERMDLLSAVLTREVG